MTCLGPHSWDVVNVGCDIPMLGSTPAWLSHSLLFLVLPDAASVVSGLESSFLG